METAKHVDTIWTSLNPLGLYQVTQFAVIFLSTTAAGFQLLSNVFTGQKVPHHCAAPGNETAFLLKYAHGGESEIFSNLSFQYEKCQISLYANSTRFQSFDCLYGMEYDQPRDKSFRSYFDLVCDRSNLYRLSQTLVFAGQGVGAVVASGLSDRFGRRPLILISNIGLLAVGLIIAYAPNYLVYCIGKFIVGGFQQGVITSCATTRLEMMPTKHRRVAVVVSGSTWAVTCMTLALVCFLLKEYSWRTMHASLSLVSALVFIQFFFLDESLCWLIANGKNKEATKIIEKAARMNKKNAAAVVEAFESGDKYSISSNHKSLHVSATNKLTFLDLFKVRRLLVNALCVWTAWFTTCLSFFIIYLTSTSLAGNPYLNFFLVALMELPCTFFYYFFYNSVGRKKCIIFFLSMVGGGLLLAGIFKANEEKAVVFSTLTTVSTMIAMVGASGCFSGIFNFTPEIFPTNLRNQAVGISSFVGRIGAMLAPFSGLLAEQAVWAPGLMIGLMACCVGFFFTFLPETSNRELPQTIEELQNWEQSEKSANGQTSVNMQNVSFL